MKNKTLAISVIFVLACAFTVWLFGNGWSRTQAPKKAAASPMPAHSVSAPVNPFLQQLKANKMTVGELTDGLGLADGVKRRQAAEAIVALHDHYCLLTQNIIDAGYVGRNGDMSTRFAMDTLAEMRPKDERVYDKAARHIDFEWMPIPVSFAATAGSYSATNVLVRGGLVSLPALGDLIAATPRPAYRAPFQNQNASYACLVSILGPATAPWLRQQATSARTPVRKDALACGAQFTATEWAKPRDENHQIPLLQTFDNAEVLQSSFNDNDYKDINIKRYAIDWDAPHNIASADKHAYLIAPAVSKASDDTTFTLALIQYVIMERLEQHATDRSAGYDLYASEAQTDAVRVLGCLRPVWGDWVIWERIRIASLHQPIEEQDTDDLKADYRALGQIDIPAVSLLVGRISVEWAPQQQQAGAYALSKIAGQYAPSFIQEKIDQQQRWADLAGQTGRKSKRDFYLNQNKRLDAALKYGAQKNWFTGDFYGAGDPHAYDLQFTTNSSTAMPALSTGTAAH